jgi:hypothetical protein
MLPGCVLVGHLPSAILRLPAFVSRSPPDNSCMYPSRISRSLCSAGIVRCTKPLAQSCNETNSSWVNGADKSGFIFHTCASGAAVQVSHPATIKLSHYRAFRPDVRPARMWQRGCFPTKTLAWPRRLYSVRDRCAVLRTLLQCVCTQRRNRIGQLSPFSEYVPAALRNKWNPPPQSNWTTPSFGCEAP